MTHSMVHGVECLPQTFLRNGGTLTELHNRYGIEVRRHQTFQNLVQLKYSQIASPMQEALVQECRGLILDEDDGWRIIAWPFKKFFNYGEQEAASIDWATAEVQEKLDGSLLIMYWYDGAWRVGTSGMPDAAGNVHGTKWSFAQLFWATFEKLRFELPKPICRAHTHMFEMTGPFNRIVVRHDETNLHLLGLRSVYSGIEVPVSERLDYNPVRTFGLQSYDDITKTFDHMDPLKQEGYVVVDGAFNRVKVKHPGYVALHQIKSCFSVKRVVDVVRRGEHAEVLNHFPEWRGQFEQVQARYDGLVTHLQQHYDDIQHIEDRKTFALAAQANCPYFPTMFHLRDGAVSTVRESLKGINIETLIDLLGVRGMVLEGAI